jgi:hypothetical protein
MQGMDEDKAQEFEEEIGMQADPQKEAQEALRAHQEAMGIIIENPDAPVAPDAKSIAMAEDEEIKGGFMGDTRRGRR